VFVIREKPHIGFKREDDNLICNETISLKEALCEFTLKKQGIDERYVSLNIANVVQPNSESLLKDGGMPRKNGGRVDLIFRFNIKLHDLDESIKNKLKVLLL
jgi:DnaJ-class molecular chaperone